MPELGLTVYARNREQAEYLVRSRAEQRGVAVTRVDVSYASVDAWFVTVTVTDLAQAEAARLDEDTTVLYLSHHRRR